MDIRKTRYERVMPSEEDYKKKIKELQKEIKKYRIMNNQKNFEIQKLKESKEP